MKTRPLAGFALLLAFGFVVAGCKPAAKPQSSDAKPAGVPVTVATATNASWDRTVSIIGTLYPKDTATIAAQVAGTVEKTLVDFGDRVSAGQELADIDTASYEAHLQQEEGNVAKTEANLTNAKQDFERVQNLNKNGIASQADFDRVNAALAQADADVKATHGSLAVARLNLERSRVVSPFDGGVSQRFVGRGDFVNVGSPLFEVVNDAVLKFIFQVPEKFASKVQKQLPVTFEVDNYPGRQFRGSVYLISPSVSTASRSFKVGALVTNTDFELKASTFARGTLVVEPAQPTIVVPLEAVVTFAGVTKVFVVSNQVAHSRDIVVGRIREGLQEVVSGLKAGDEIVVTGHSKLTEGTPVTLPTSGPPDGKRASLPSHSESTNRIAEHHEKL
ncbi:efflux RND transporter periplasmic adaptor subunit [bacterium]|nr:efflux RND transporter periplasmic adaptor subunit [bacterium]